MRVLFMGTPDFAVPSLTALILSDYDMAGVVTQPDKPKGRGRKLAEPPVKEIARIYGLDVLQPENLRDEGFVNILREMAPDVIVVVAYGKLIPPAILGIPKYGCINVHASLLPRYRGAAPIHRAIIDGETKTGVSLMYLSEELDAGDVIRQASTDILESDNVGALHDRLAELGASLLLKVMGEIKTIAEADAGHKAGSFAGSNSIKCAPQDDSRATYAPILTRRDEKITWGKPAGEIFNQIRGLDPWPGAFTYLGGKTLKIWCALRTDCQCGDSAQPGSVLQSDKDELLVKTGDRVLSITELQLQGSRRMSVADFLRGRTIAPGTILGVLPEKRV